MRLVAWNAARRFRDKLPLLDGLGFDLALVSECSPLHAHESPLNLSAQMHQPVGALNGDKHLGLIARSPWTLSAIDLGDDYPWCSAARVTGPRPFTLLGIWAQTPGLLPGKPSYAAQTAIAIEEVLPSLAGDVVLGGDLNAPNRERSEVARHAANVSALREAGLVSAFATARGEGQEALEPTYFHTWNEAMPFHIDHVFLPAHWASGVSVTIGTYADWVAPRHSDHVPVIVDVPAASHGNESRPLVNDRH